ncbi:hypothetical protein ABZ249_30120 [Nocardiopsis sp. NPDC006139]|uniref:hypothetical protein n=1 Tax=Nocardiopsis sp. NPDC006139 TaxID=3154578 RepID=UPI0033A1E703
MTNTCACGRPLHDAHLCTGCINQATDALRRVLDGLDADLTTTMAKQGTRPTSHSGGHGKASEAPMPLLWHASEARTDITTALREWVTDARTSASPIHSPTCKTCTHRRCQDIHRQTRPLETMGAMAHWLLPLVGWSARRPWGPERAYTLIAAVQKAVKAVDTPEERIGVGRCPRCDHPVYAPASRIIAYCKTEDCGGIVDVQQWQQSLQQLAWDHQAGATELASFATKHLGMSLKASTIRSWAHRGKLSPANPGEATPRYRFADVAALAGAA